MDLGEDIELFASATGAVLAADQIMKSINSEEHAVSHLVKAGIGDAVAIGAYELLLRAQNEDNANGYGRHVSAHSSRVLRRIRDIMIVILRRKLLGHMDWGRSCWG
jgi:hypothetical protein